MTTIREYQKQTGHSVHSAKNQRILEKFVSRNVERNVSMLVEHFLRNPEALNGSDYDWEELVDLGKRIDWDEAVNDTAKDMSRSDCRIYLEERGFEVQDEETVDELREAVYQDVMCEDMEYWQDFVNDQDIVDLAEYEMEALEFWIVDERFREKLAEKGEATVEEFFGMPVWGRTTSGQGIAMDAIVAEIALDIGILVGQENEWRL
jgi:hypothetical protein